MRFFSRMLDFILPTSCSYCRSPIGNSRIPYFCASCWDDFSPIREPVCVRCGKPFESPEALSHSPGHECSACRTKPPFFDQSLSIGYFEGPLREAIHQYKYRPCRALGRPLGLWMADHTRLLSDIDVIIPVPLHTARLKLRGFNQALLLAYQMQKKFEIRLSYGNLIRVKPTRPQVELNSEDRIRNVAGAFALTSPDIITGKKILLIDDVFTSGATMNECSSVLKNAGAKRVNALTLARAV